MPSTLSIIIPAFNESKELPLCLATVNTAIAGVVAASRRWDLAEIIVVDNNSTDNTSEVAQMMGATVLFEPLNQILHFRAFPSTASID